MELISVSEVVNEYSNKYLVVKRRVAEDGLILLCKYKTILSVLKVRKGKSVKSDEERKVRKEFENCIFYRQQNSKQNWLNNRCLRFITIINHDKALQIRVVSAIGI